jgi:hypothetical protein
MSVDKLPVDQYTPDRRQANNSIKEQINIIIKHIDALKQVDKNERMQKAVFDFYRIIRSGDELTDAQRSYLENIYESTISRIAGSDQLKVPQHIDRKTNLRYNTIR